MKGRSWLVLLLVILLFSLVPVSFNASGKVKVFLNGRQLGFDVNPEVVEGRVLVPMRSIFEHLGAGVEWDRDTRTVTAIKGDTTLKIAIGQKTALKNGETIPLDVPAILIRGRTMVPLRLVSEALGARVEWDEKSRSVYIEGDPLPSVGTYENLKRLLAEAESSVANVYPAIKVRAAEAVLEDAPATAGAVPGAAGYSTTNVQVRGVDEADIVKTDGQYIYQVNNGRVVVVKASPPGEMKIQTILEFDAFVPRELYVDQKYLVVIGSTGQGPVRIMEDRARPQIYPPVPLRSTVKAVVYDVTDKRNPRKQREVELEGDYVSSRKIGAALYLVANLPYYQIKDQERVSLAPSYRDSAGNNEFVEVGYADIRYFPDSLQPNYLMVAGLNLDRQDEPMQVATYLGAGQNLYASQDSLYVAITRYQHVGPVPLQQGAPIRYVLSETGTVIYRFALDNGRVKYRAKGEVPGSILNQFSMDEYGGYFRIATTRGEAWRDDEHTSRNNLYVLDGDLRITGRLENVAPGERIYSVRFMGDRGYMVTFKQVDPLFVIDLKDPRRPAILGKLKIPGYSDYLHPYDENHLIGFGKDTVEVPRKDGEGRETGTVAFYQGMKIAVFDVTDVEHPVEMFVERIGGRGTDSELLRNHKALLFDRDRNLLAFPVTVMEVKNQVVAPGGIPAYGEFTFQGAYVYRLDLENGFRLRGRITHLAEEDYLKTGHGWYGSNKNVERILYIGDALYTLSGWMIKAHDLDTLTEKGSLSIPQ